MTESKSKLIKGLSTCCLGMGAIKTISSIIGSIMLLVPGLAITNALRDTISGDLLAGLTRATEAFLVAISIAVGTGSVIGFWISMFGGI